MFRWHDSVAEYLFQSVKPDPTLSALLAWSKKHYFRTYQQQDPIAAIRHQAALQQSCCLFVSPYSYLTNLVKVK